jgi:hypothetical protein
MPRKRSADKNVSHLRIKRPIEGDRNYGVMKELWDFLNEVGELPFDPPFVSRPPAGSEAQVARAVYLMVVGLEQMKEMYPKNQTQKTDGRAGAVAAAPAEEKAVF